MYPFLFFCLPFGDDIKPQNFCNLPQVSTMLPTIPQQLNNSFILSSCLYFHRTTIPKVSTMVILFKHIQYNADLMGNLANTSYFRIVKLGARARLVAVPRFVLETLISFGRPTDHHGTLDSANIGIRKQFHSYFTNRKDANDSS